MFRSPAFSCAAALVGAALSGTVAAGQGTDVLRPAGGIPGAAQPTAEQLFSPQLALPLSFSKPAGLRPGAAVPGARAESEPAPLASAAPAPSAPAGRPADAAAPVPMPTPRPAIADAAPTPITPAQTASATQTASAGRGGAPVPVTPVQQDQDRAGPDVLQRVSDYWNRVQVLSGNFVQVDPDGSRKTGDFYMQKPGRVRFEYDAPVPLELVSNGQSVAVRDRKLNTQDITPLSQTPLRFLLAQTTDLARDPHVAGAYQDNLYVTVVMEEKVPMMGTYKLMLLFDAKTYALKQWIVTDPQGYDTSVAVSNLNSTSRPDPKLFVINFERMLQ